MVSGDYKDVLTLDTSICLIEHEYYNLSISSDSSLTELYPDLKDGNNITLNNQTRKIEQISLVSQSDTTTLYRLIFRNPNSCLPQIGDNKSWDFKTKNEDKFIFQTVSSKYIDQIVYYNTETFEPNEYKLPYDTIIFENQTYDVVSAVLENDTVSKITHVYAITKNSSSENIAPDELIIKKIIEANKPKTTDSTTDTQNTDNQNTDDQNTGDQILKQENMFALIAIVVIIIFILYFIVKQR